MKRIIENHLAEIIVVSIMLIAFSSCTSTHYVCDAYAINTEKVQEDIDELSYYIQEDAFNGNLDSTVVQIYIDKIDELNKELMYISGYGCENCDEID